MAKVLLVLFPIILFFSCSDGTNSTSSDLTEWENVKSGTAPTVALGGEYGEAQRLSLGTMGWEDGLNVSRDGLHLYATYIPADFLSYTINDGVDASQIEYYDRGPHFDMDFDGSSIGITEYPWYQSDIIYSSRSSVDGDFSDWSTSAMKRSVYSEGALSTVFSDTGMDICAFTSNENYTELNNIKVITDTDYNPSGTGVFLTATDTTGTDQVNTNYVEDNPHLERLDENTLVLFFDSEDRPGGEGSHDIWYSTSADDGASWTTPVNVSSVNSADKEHQPHLYHDGSEWWLYYSAYYSDGKLAIYRCSQSSADWNDWGTPELVLSAGNSAGIGEPTLTEEGDLYFVLIYENPDGTYYDRYDADPWVLER
ncbi:MAG: sialidase family protein, partial [Spirochaetales bacterium]|nr:sialidase family protein [Spirochaetales bacterium]